jgi:hypothetical protein
MRGKIAHRYDSGQGMVEYGLILVGVVIIVIGALAATGSSVGQVYCTVLSGLGAEGCGDCSYAFNDISEFSKWEGKDLDNVVSVENNKACFTGDGSHPRTFLNPCAKKFGGSDYMINVNDVTVDRSTGSRAVGFDVQFRSEDENNGYQFTYNTKGDFVRFWKVVEGKRILLKSQSVPKAWGEQENDFQIQVEGDTFTAYRDGAPLIQVADRTFTEGSAGIRNKPSAKTCIGDMTINTIN